MKYIRSRFPLLIIAAVSFVFFIIRLGRDMLYDWDECIYASYTHAMRAGNNYMVNVFNGTRVFDKPPLYMWILALGTALGENEFAFRILSVFASLAIIVSVYLFSERYFSGRVAVLSSLLLLATDLFVTHAVVVNTDIFFTLFIFLGIWSWLEGRGYLAGALLGLGVMVKGLGSLQFLGVIFLCALIERNKGGLRTFLKLLVAFLIVILPWHMFAYLAFGKVFIQQYLYDNVIKRSLYAIENHHEHWYFYFRLLVNDFFPYIVFLVVLPAYLFRRIRHVRSARAFMGFWERERVAITLTLMTILPLLSMTKVMTKLSWYTLPLYPLLAILIAFSIEVFLRKFSSSYMQGALGSTLLKVIYAVVLFIIIVDASITVVRSVRIAAADRNVSHRNEAILKTKKYPQNNLEYLVPFGERQGQLALPPQETVMQTFLYGGNACAVYYSGKHVNYYYTPVEFIAKARAGKGLFLIENGDTHFIDPVENKKILFKNIEYTLFSF